MGGFKISLPKINVPKAIDPSRALKGTVAAVKRSDIGVAHTATLKAVTFQKMTGHENKVFQNTVKIGAVAAGGYALAGTSTGAAVTGGIKVAGAKIGAGLAANPLTTAAAGYQLSRGNTKGAVQSVASVSGVKPDDFGIPTPKFQMPELASGVRGNLDTIQSMLISNSPERATLANTSSKAPLTVVGTSNATEQTMQKRADINTGPNNQTLIIAGVGLVLGLVILKNFKVI